MLQTLKYFFSRVYTITSIVLFALSYGAIQAYAVYYPTDNITNPTCAPGDSGCYVSLLPQVGGRSIVYLPDQTSFSGTVYIGSNGGANLTYSSGTQGQKNTFVGINSGNANTTAFDNTGIGYNALASTTTGFRNTAVGSGALASSTTANFSTAVGERALTLDNGGSNSAFGFFSGGNNLTGTGNNSFGRQSLETNTAGSNNNSFGNFSLSRVTGSNNTAFGSQSGRAQLANADVSNNIFIGGLSGLNISTGGDGNTIVASYDGSSTAAISSGSYNTFMGYRAGANLTTGSYNIALGQNVTLPSITGSGQLNIGNLIYGTGIYSGSSVSSSAITSGKIGIAVSNPVSTLHIGVSPTASANYGTLSLGGGPFDGATSGYFGTSSSSNTNGTSLAINEASGYAGDLINLQVAGVSKLKLASTGNLTVDSGAVNNTLTLSTSGVGTIQSNFYNSNTNTVAGTSVFYMPVNTYRGGSLSTLPIAALQAVYKGDGTTGSVGRLGQWWLRTGGGGAGNFTTLIVGPENFMAMPSANSKFGINYTGTDIDNNTIPASFAVKGYGATSTTFTAQFHNSTGTSNSLVIRDDGKVGIGTASPVSAHFQVGSSTVNNSSNTQILVSENINDTGSGSAHGISDSSQISRSGSVGYASFDARINFVGSNNFDHYVGFQSGPAYDSTGTIGNLYGIYDAPLIRNGTVTNRYGVKITTPGVTSPGSLLNNYGIYVDQQYSGSLTNYGIYVAGSTANNNLGGGTTYAGIIAAGNSAEYSPTYQLNIKQSSGDTGMRIWNVGGGNYWNLYQPNSSTDFAISDVSAEYLRINYNGGGYGKNFTSHVRMINDLGVAPSANYGTLSMGSKPFNGSTSGYFVGSASGTMIAINETSGFVGDFVNAQLNGASKFKIDYNGLPTFSALVSCGGIQTNGSGTLSCTSDERLKDVQNDFTKGLESIRNINPKAFSWKQDSNMYDGGVVYNGFIAQNIQSSLPEAVTLSSDGIHLQVSQLTLLAASINAIKELDIKVNQLSSLDSEINGTFGYLAKEFLGNASNSITDLYAKVVHSDKVETKELCIDDLCITKAQLQQMLNQSNQNSVSNTTEPESTPEVIPPTEIIEEPVVTPSSENTNISE